LAVLNGMKMAKEARFREDFEDLRNGLANS
jgi:hypothetical protein